MLQQLTAALTVEPTGILTDALQLRTRKNESIQLFLEFTIR